MEVLELGHLLLALSCGVTVVVLVSCIAGLVLRSRRPIVAARYGLHALFLLILGSVLCLVAAFQSGEYNNDYIYNYSERLLPPFFKIAGLWAGLDGSLLFWTFLLCGFGSAVALQHRKSSLDPMGRRMEPWVYLALAGVTLFFVLVTWHQNPFKSLPIDKRMLLGERHGIPLDEAGNLLDGAGLSQQLVNYWFVIHPPTLYLGFVAWTVPFAFAVAGLCVGEIGAYWIRIVRLWTLLAWVFLTSGIILGGLWAYRQLGWGGYWAWDPVENASFLPWLTGTAFLHSILITARRDMLKGWNLFLILLTFFLTIVGTWMTRSGVVSSVHAFAGGDIGTWFMVFLYVLAGISVFLVFFRFRTLRGTQEIQSLLSREAVFFINNMLFVILAAVIFFLSFFPKLSHDWFAKTLTDQGMYNIVCTPFFALLLFLTALGPGLGWVGTSRAMLRRFFVGPALATLGFTILLYGFLYARGLLGTWQEILVPRLKDQHPAAFYPTGLFLALAFFICATVLGEILRGARARGKTAGEGPLTAVGRLLTKNNRRYGGYLSHVGLALLAAGIIVSSMFKTKEDLTLKVGEAARVGPYWITPVDQIRTDAPLPGEPYLKDLVVFRVLRAKDASLPVAHGEARDTRDTRPDLAGASFVAEVRPERRYYPKKDQWISEVTIHRRVFEDIYIYFSASDRQGNIALTVFLNPFMFLIYLGWFVMIGGVIFAALPLGAARAAAGGAPVTSETGPSWADRERTA